MKTLIDKKSISEDPVKKQDAGQSSSIKQLNFNSHSPQATLSQFQDKNNLLNCHDGICEVPTASKEEIQSTQQKNTTAMRSDILKGLHSNLAPHQPPLKRTQKIHRLVECF